MGSLLWEALDRLQPTAATAGWTIVVAALMGLRTTGSASFLPSGSSPSMWRAICYLP